MASRYGLNVYLNECFAHRIRQVAGKICPNDRWNPGRIADVLRPKYLRRLPRRSKAEIPVRDVGEVAELGVFRNIL
jgi:hypothetical protein